MSREDTLMEYYRAMHDALGPSEWWPGETPFEVAVGTVLVQNTNWGNVEKALALLKKRGPLTPARLLLLSPAELEECLKPSGYFRIKTRRLRALLECMAECAGVECGTDYSDAPDYPDGSGEPDGPDYTDRTGSVNRWDGREDILDGPLDDGSLRFWTEWGTHELREKLLEVRGVGQETADCILLYALHRPVFVVDAYTRRIFHRHALVGEEDGYEELQEFFMDVLPADTALFNEYHALIVRTGNNFCKKSKPLCGGCPLRPFLEYEPV